MKVIESNVNHEVRQKRCDYCKSLLEFDERDIVTPQQIDFKDLKFITCPECGRINIIKDQEK